MFCSLKSNGGKILKNNATDLLENKNVWLYRVKRSCSCAVIGGFDSLRRFFFFLFFRPIGCRRDYDDPYD